VGTGTQRVTTIINLDGSYGGDAGSRRTISTFRLVDRASGRLAVTGAALSVVRVFVRSTLSRPLVFPKNQARQLRIYVWIMEGLKLRRRVTACGRRAVGPHEPVC